MQLSKGNYSFPFHVMDGWMDALLACPHLAGHVCHPITTVLCWILFFYSK